MDEQTCCCSDTVTRLCIVETTLLLCGRFRFLDILAITTKKKTENIDFDEKGQDCLKNKQKKKAIKSEKQK